MTHPSRLNFAMILFLLALTPLNSVTADETSTSDIESSKNVTALANIVDPLFSKDRIKGAVATFTNGAGQCSGTFVSNEGHFLTAYHCIRANVFLKDGDEQLQNAIASKSILYEFDASIHFDEDSAFNHAHFKVVAMGNGMISRDTANELGNSVLVELDETGRKKQMISEMIKNQLGPQSDWIVLKVTPKIQERPIKHSCLKAGTGPIRTGNRLLATGFPGQSSWSSARLNASNGIVFEGTKDSRCSRYGPAKAQFAWEREMNKVTEDQKRLLWFSGHVEQGMSGGSVLNLQNEIEGIISGSPVCENSFIPTWVVPISTIMRQIDEQHRRLPEVTDAVDRIFSCEE